MMPWDAWLETWRAHAQTDRFRRRVDSAVGIAREGAEYATPACMFGALSGGKDGVALAAIVARAGIDVRWCHVHTELNTPRMLETAEACAERLDLDLDITEPAIDVWAFLATLPRDGSILDESLHLAMRKAMAAGNLLVAYQYEQGFKGSYSGMRSEESRGRRWNRKMRGPLYQLTTDGTWMCLPIVDWTARDVFAAAVAWELPIHPHYRLALERLGIEPESPQSRVDSMIPEDRVTRLPAGMQCRILYPDLWRRLVAARPELRAHGG